MPLRFPNTGIEGIKHVSYLAVDQENKSIIVTVTLEAQDQFGFSKTMAKASEKYDEGQVDSSSAQPRVEVKTTDFKV